MNTAWARLKHKTNWPNLSEAFPAFVHHLPALASLMGKEFQSKLDTQSITQEQIGVFGLGRLAVEDFLEIVFLAEHGFGTAALKLLRGLYERAITAEYISNNRDEAQRFFDFYLIQSHKLRSRNAQVYKDSDLAAPSEGLSEYNRVKSQFAIEECPTCGQPRQHGFSKKSLEGIAHEVGEVWKKRDNRPTKDPNQFARAYLIGAAIPNIHIHASIHSFLSRCTWDGQGHIYFEENQGLETRLALSHAHAMMTLVLDTQNRYFGLGLDSEIEQICREFDAAWPASAL